MQLKLIFFFVNAEFYRVVWIINALLTVHPEMLPFSGNNQNINVQSPPEHFAIGYVHTVHNDNLHWAMLHYNMPFKTIAGRSDGVFWLFPALSEDHIFFFFFIHKNLSCGFNKVCILVLSILPASSCFVHVGPPQKIDLENHFNKHDKLVMNMKGQYSSCVKEIQFYVLSLDL